MKTRAIGVLAIALLPGAGLPATLPAPVTADARAPLIGLLAAAQLVAQPPAIATLVQAGSIEDMVHLRAALAGLRSELAVRIAQGRHADAPGTTSIYRLPVAGRLVTGFGTVSEAGVRSRGLTFAVPPGAPVVAPAAGVVRYAQAFRGYGGTVIVDHGAGWTSVLTGLGTLAVREGGRVRGGAAIGTARRGGRRQVTVELRRRGEPVDAAPLIR